MNNQWVETTVADFLQLTPEESMLVELKVALSLKLREARKAQNVSQTVAAQRINTSQSRFAKMEAADETVSTDLLLRGLFSLGMTPKDIGEVLIATKKT